MLHRLVSSTKWLSIALLACASLACGRGGMRPVESNSYDESLVYGTYDVVHVSRAPGTPHGPIALIRDSKNKYTSTGFMIDECHLLTVQHAEFDHIPAPKPLPKLKAYFGVGNYNGFEDPVEATIEKFGEFDESQQNNLDDWMLLRLADCGKPNSVGKRFGYFQLDLTSEKDLVNVPLESAGYTHGEPLTNGVPADQTCTVRAADYGMLLHDCAGLAGNSGSPILRAIKDSQGRTVRYVVVGMQTRAINNGQNVQWTHDNSNLALPIRVAWLFVKDSVSPARKPLGEQ